MFLYSRRNAINDIVYTVFPKPISSAKIPFMPISYNDINQFNPVS